VWQKLDPVAVGGTVFDIHVNHAGQIWLATGAGILRQDGQSWSHIGQGQPVPSIVALCSAPAEDEWWAASLSGHIAHTQNGGQSWELCWLDQVSAPVVCLVTSPRFSTNQTLLAGTNGAGILRSTDGGRRWYLSNFGLQDFTILDLATAPDWSRREILFAGSPGGIYRSSGGGRAWKHTGLEDIAVVALAVSQRFDRNGLVLAGSEGQGIFRSVDGGKSWQPARAGLAPNCSVNALLRYGCGEDEYWLAATGDGSLWQSDDEGQVWAEILAATEPGLTLAEGPGQLLAGLKDGGLLTSTDNGRSWLAASPLYGRGWQRLLTGQQDRLLAIAPPDGVWLSTDRGQSWSQTIAASPDSPVLAFAAVGNIWLAARPEGLWQRTEKTDWQLIMPTEEAPVAALAAGTPPKHPLWAATTDSQVWQSVDDGATWRPVASPSVGQQLLSFASTAPDSTLLIACLNSQRDELNLWRKLADGDHWEHWFNQALDQPYAQLVAHGERANQSWLIINREVWRHTKAGWQQIGSFDHPIRRAAVDSTGEKLHVLVGPDIMVLAGPDEQWLQVTLPADADPLVDLIVTENGRLGLLDLSGRLWLSA
jgi:photosystem II stability/assembly factor-like uncharacterized protein